MTINPPYRLLTLAEVEPAANVIAQAYVDDPLCSFMLPRKSSRLKTLQKFFRAQGEVGIKNKRGYGVGEPLQGVASRLIRPFLEMADQQKVIVYTDTVTAANVPLYEHFGFVCMEASVIRGTGLTVWALRRPVQ